MDQMETIIKTLIKDLNIEQSEGCGNLPIPSAFDDKVTAMIEWFKKAGKHQRTELLNTITDHYSFLLLSYSERMAVRAVRDNNPIHILNGLIAVAIENFRFDSREDLLILPLHINSAVKIGINPRELFENAAVYAISPVAETFKSFAAYDPQKVHIQSMGYVEEMTTEGFNYRRAR